MTKERLAEIEARAAVIPNGVLNLCAHLADAHVDKVCPCGYRGGIYAVDGEHIVCEMGSSKIPGEDSLEPPRLDRGLELAYAQLFAHAPADITDLIARVRKLEAENERLRAVADSLRDHVWRSAALLGQVEWSVGDYGWLACPDCEGAMPDDPNFAAWHATHPNYHKGHWPSCDLVRLKVAPKIEAARDGGEG